MNRWYCRLALLLIPFAFACFALVPQARAQVCQHGCDTNNGDTFLGEDANTRGVQNTAIGWRALFSNTTGFNNTAIGGAALVSNTTGQENTAIGFNALVSNTTGSLNTATGLHALASNSTGGLNTATGNGTLGSNTSGFENMANGDRALAANTNGSNNTASGAQALYSNTIGNFNTATGFRALLNNITGGHNIALGFKAGANLTTGHGNIDIGNPGRPGESSTIRIGREEQSTTFIAGISGVTVPDGVGVIVDASGHLGTTTSSARFKEGIKPMDKASEAILALKPVTFRYKPELDPEGIPQFGLVAEQVEKVNPALVARDADGKAYTVRYEAVNAMLLNEFLKEHRKVDRQDRTLQAQEATITQLKSTVAQQQKDFQAAAAHQQEQIEALTAGLQRVSAQFELSRRAPQTVVNNH